MRSARYPSGCIGIAPANLTEPSRFPQSVNYDSRQHLDEKSRWIDVMTEASILPVNKRPRLAVRIHSSN